MNAATNLLLGQGGKPTLNLIDSGRGSRREISLETRMTDKSVLHRRRLVGTVVVHDQLHAEIGRHIGVDGAQKLEKLGATMTAVHFADHFAGGDFEGSGQRRRTMAHATTTLTIRRFCLDGVGTPLSFHMEEI